MNVSIGPLAAATGLIVAASLMTVGIRKGYPMPTAFTVSGAVIGVGVSKGVLTGFGVWEVLAVAKYREMVALWLVIPVVGGGIAFGTAYLLRKNVVPESVSIPVLGGMVGMVLANVPLIVIPSEMGPGTVAKYVSAVIGSFVPVFDGVGVVVVTVLAGVGGFVVMWLRVSKSVEKGTKEFLVVLGAIVAFSSGGSQVGLAIGPLSSLFESELHLPVMYLLVGGGVGILVGAWTGAPRLIYAVSREYSNLGIRRSIAALIPAFVIAQLAIVLGVPISFNEVIISAIIGSGLVEGRSGVSRQKIGYTVVAWVSSLGISLVLGFILYRLVYLFIGAAG